MELLAAIIEHLHSDDVLWKLAGGQILTESPSVKTDVSKDPFTIIGIHLSEDAKDPFQSTHRDVSESEVEVVVEVLSAKGENDSYCRAVAEYTRDSLLGSLSFITDTWRAHIRGAKLDVAPEGAGRWRAKISISADYFNLL